MAAPARTTCANHPKRERVAVCGSCESPLCRDCVVHTPVGIKCPACTGEKAVAPVPRATPRASQPAREARERPRWLVPGAIAAAVVLVALGGGVVMTLPYALLMPLMDDAEHGTLTGFYGVSRGVGIAAGPLLAGAAIGLTGDLFAGTGGYQATWGVCAAAVLLSLVPLRRLRAATT
jgi:MFS family permease